MPLEVDMGGESKFGTKPISLESKGPIQPDVGQNRLRTARETYQRLLKEARFDHKGGDPQGRTVTIVFEVEHVSSALHFRSQYLVMATIESVACRLMYQINIAERSSIHSGGEQLILNLSHSTNSPQIQVFALTYDQDTKEHYLGVHLPDQSVRKPVVISFEIT